MTAGRAADGRYEQFQRALRFGARVLGGDVPPAWAPDGSAAVVLDYDPATAGLVLHRPLDAPLLLVPIARLADELATEPARLVSASMAWLPDGTLQVDVDDRRLFVDTGSGHSWPEPDSERALRELGRPRVVRPPLLTNRPPVRELSAPDGSWLATERDHDLWLRQAGGPEERRLTMNGRADAPWEIEFGAWSTDSRHLLALRVDNTDVPTLPVVTWTGTHEQVDTHPYPRPGDPFPRTSAHVFDVATGESMALDLGADELFWFSPAGFAQTGELLLLTSDRYNTSLTLHAVDLAAGSSRVVVAEHSSTFVYGIRLEQFESCVWPLPDGPELIWMSERDGYRQAYLYALDGTCLAQLTHGSFDVDRVLGAAPDGDVFLLAHSDMPRPYDRHICRVSADGTSFRQLTVDPGMHDGWPAPDGQHVLDTHSDLARPPRTDLLTADGDLVRTVARADSGVASLLAWTPPEEIRETALDRVTELHGVLLHPPGFDPAGRYPLVEVIYGGPQSIAHPRDYRQSANPLAFALSQLGFVVLVLDAPGTPGRGKAFQDTVFRRFGQREVAEHAAVVRRLVDERPYLDSSRVGIVGGSWGGYMVLRALCTAADVYSVGADLYGVGDLYDHMARAIEPYMGPLESNPDGYAAGDVLPLLKDLRGKLLVLHGTSDVNATLSACLKVVDALTAADKDFDLVLIPGMQHAFVGPGAAYGLRRTVSFLTDHLLPERP